MSIPLQDHRTKITPETEAVLEAVNKATGRDMSAITRDVLHSWAVKEIHASNVLQKILAREGLKVASAGTEGNKPESDRP
jgi:hypothetical protein